MKASIRPDHCIALRLIASQEHYRKSQDWLNMVPEWERLVEVAEQSQAIIKMQADKIEKLRERLEKAHSFISRADWMQFFEEEHDAAAALKEMGDGA